MPLQIPHVKPLFFALVVDDNTCLVYKTSMHFSPTQPKTLVLIMTVLCLMHGFVLSWRHLQSEWGTNTQGGVLTLNLQYAPQEAPLAVPMRPKKTITQKLPVTESAPARSQEVPTEAASPLSQMASADLKQMYLAELRAMIERHKVYPLQASRLGQTGVVEVSFTLTSDGHIIDSRISKPCPFQRLNEAALNAVNGLRHFRPIPPEIGSEAMAVTVPIRYSLYN